jgi:ABC-type sugar transport system ATPase subunit
VPSLSIEKLKKSYGKIPAIHEMDLAIADGAFCVFLGPSGCGKSTTLNCIAGLETASSGRILLGERDITDLPPYRRDIAMVFQSSLLYPHLTGAQNIRMSLRGVEAAEIDRRIAHTVAMLDIAKLLDKKPGTMSGGERQRVAMAKAIVRNPAAFLMDEPLAALDAALRQSLRAELVHLQKRLGVTTIFVTHDQVEAMTMGDVIVVMNGGRIEQVGSPQEIYEKPRTRFVAGFIGSPPMNFIRGRLTREGDKAVLRSGSTTIVLANHLVPATSGKGEEVDVGFRPQHIAISSQAIAGSAPATVYAVERLGKENVVVLEGETKETLRALTEPTANYAIGDRVFLVPDPSHAHILV